MRGEIIKLHQRLGSTTVYVTHDQVEAMTMGSRVAVLKDGVLVQVDTAQKLYEKPHNVFVATFIGSPAMNILAGTVGQENGAGVAYGDGMFALPANTPTRLAGRKVKLGVRPEHLSLASPSGKAQAGVTGKVSLVEIMGDESIVTLTQGSETIRAKVRGFCALKPDDEVEVTAAPDKIHLFDAETSERLEIGK